MSWNKGANLVNVPNVLKIDYKLDVDAYWGTGYQGGLYSKTGVALANDFNFEKYWLQINSLASAKLIIEFEQFYKLQLTAFFEPFTYHPLELTALFFRPKSTNSLDNFDICFRFTSLFNALKFYLKIQEQGKVTYKSISSYLASPSTVGLYPTTLADFGYNPSMSVERLDPFYQYYVIDKLLP